VEIAMHKRHLQALGITPWTRRSIPAEPTDCIIEPNEAAEQGFARINQPQVASGTLLVEWPDAVFALTSEHPGGQLLSGIMKAMAQQLDQFLVLQLHAAKSQVAEVDLPLEGSVVLCFSEHWQAVEGLRDGREWLVLPSLPQMLSDQQFKRQAWQKLKPWSQKLK
jgi:hypothetical protein